MLNFNKQQAEIAQVLNNNLNTSNVKLQRKDIKNKTVKQKFKYIKC